MKHVKYVLTIGLVAFLSGCTSYGTVRIAMKDVEKTMDCNTDPIFIDPADTKKELMGRIVVLNGRLDGCDNSKYYTKRKIDKYLRIN